MALTNRVFGVLSMVLLLAGAFAASSTAVEPATEGESSPDPYAVPDGDAAGLIEFIERLLQSRPADLEAREKTVAAINAAADRILAGEATDEQVEAVVRLKMNLLGGQPEALAALTEKLSAAGREALARQVQGALLAARLRASMQGPREEAAPAVEQAVQQIVAFLDAGPFAASDVQLGLTAARAAEMAGNEALAVNVYRKLGQLTAGNDDPRLASLSQNIEGIVRRLTLVGNPIEIEGTTLAGEEFDWSQYAGKTVLVDFWATWCGPCVREIPTLKRLYEAYHEQGFDIVGISLDRSRAPLEKFVKERALPWTNLYEDGDRNPVAERYGVMAIPLMILVGPDGKVISTQARGATLEKLLEERFGPLPDEAPEDK